MATIFKRDGSPYYFACYSDRSGRTVRRSTKSTDRTAAIRMSLEWEGAERAAKEGVASVAAFQKVIGEISERVIGEALPSQSIRQYLEEWSAGLPKLNAGTTVERYRKTVRLFLSSLGKAADQPLRTLQPRHIEVFLHQRLESGVAPLTAIVDVKTLGTALRRAERYGYIDRNPVSLIKLPKAKSNEREVFTFEEIHKLVAAAPNEDWQTLILLGALTGARLGDCLKMTWDNVVPKEKMIIYRQAKTDKIVRLPVHADLLTHLSRLSKTGTVGSLCRSLTKQKQPGKHGLSEGFKRIARRAGLDLLEVKTKSGRVFNRRTFHSLRHTFSSILASRGVSEEIRMRLSGHTTRDIHQRYTHMGNEILQDAINSIPAKTAVPA